MLRLKWKENKLENWKQCISTKGSMKIRKFYATKKIATGNGRQ